ncbi:MAG TPA: hypothetical protein VEX35_02360 [Allosphingosinicella sp.]|jgi:hypothetical protein|nr:hypothetical protein [Allosphingosinicella sp.]
MSGTDKDQAGGSAFVPSRRTVLVLGAAAASTVVTVRPALAQAAGSVLNCEIPVPGPHAGGQYIAADGTLVAPGTPGAAAPLARRLKGEEVKSLLRSGTTPAGTDPTSAQAYANYIRRLQSGMSGFTCYASLQTRP